MGGGAKEDSLACGKQGATETFKLSLTPFSAAAQISACATADYHLFCIGLDNDGTTHVYQRDFDHVMVAGFDSQES